MSTQLWLLLGFVYGVLFVALALTTLRISLHGSS